jgi:O-antigen/teichoic acid export membrane protein
MLALNVTLNVLLLPKIGLLGAAVSAFVTLTMLFSIGLYVIKVRVGIGPYNSSYWKGIGAFLFTLIFLLAGKLFFHSEHILVLIANFVLSYALFFGFLYLMKIDDVEQQLLTSLITKFMKGIRK